MTQNCCSTVIKSQRFMGFGSAVAEIETDKNFLSKRSELATGQETHNNFLAVKFRKLSREHRRWTRFASFVHGSVCFSVCL